MKENVLIIFNPKAGKNRSRQNFETIIKAFRSRGFAVTERTTTCVGDATQIVKDNIKNKDLVVCCGGDGTFNETVNGMIAVGSKKPIMYYPMGSTNDLAHTIGVSDDIDAQIDLFLKNRIVSYDVGRLNNLHFTYIAGFGVGTDISFSTSQKMKNSLGHFAYLLNGFFLKLPDQIKKIKPHHMVIEYGDKVIEDDFYFGVILNTNEFGGIFKLDKQQIKLNDGIFDVLLVKEVRGVVDAFRLLHKIRMQDFDNDRMIRLSVPGLKIRGSDSLAWTIDGEFGGNHKDIDFEVLHAKVNLVANATDFFVEDNTPQDSDAHVFEEEMLLSSKASKRNKK